MAVHSPSSQLVTVFGGSGFLGRHVVRALAKRGYRLRVAVRRPELAGALWPITTIGQLDLVQANLRYPRSIARAASNADHVVNLVGILQPSGRQGFDAVHAEGAHEVAQAAAANGASLIHVSALGADRDSPSHYARTKALGEAAAASAVPGAVVLRPSVVFGPEDQFFNRFASLARVLPVLPIAGADTRFQPVFAGDVAKAVVKCVDGEVPGGRVYELGGPEVRTLRELIEFVCEVTERKRLVVGLPPQLAQLQAGLMEVLDTISLGLLPDELRLTRDQVSLLSRDNVVSEEAAREGRTLQGLGIDPEGIAALVPPYLIRYRKTGQFDTTRKPYSAAPDMLAPESGGRGSTFQPSRGAGPAAVGTPQTRFPRNEKA